MVPARTPFRFGAIVDGEYFADRDAEARSLGEAIRHGRNVVLISPRRFGKTSLILRVIHDLAPDADVVYLDLLRTATKARLADQLATAIYADLVSPLDRARDRAATFFDHLPLRPRVTLHPDSSVSFDFAVGPGSPVEHELDATLEHLLETLSDERRGHPVALVLDEFQEIVSLDPHLPALLRSVFQRQPDVAHVFLGSRQHLLRQVFTGIGEPLYRLAEAMPLAPISQDLLVPFIRERFAAGHSQISADAAAYLVELTGGHPNDTQELGHFTWSLAVAESKPATRATVERGLDQVLAAENARFTDLWESLSPPQRVVLQAVAIEDDVRLYSAGARRRHQLASASGVQRAAQRLVDRELIETTTRGSYRVPDVFLKAWLRRM